MANSMDTILVKYDSSSEKQNSKTATIPEFLALDPQKLTKVEQKVQTALRLIYDLNGKEPPLYKNFPTFRQDTKPLTIDITKAPPKDSSAIYNALDNKICFKNKYRSAKLAASLAHELKHAEQEDEETYKMRKDLINNDAYGFHQFTLLQEAQAYAVEAHVESEISKGIIGNLLASNLVWFYRAFAKLPFLNRHTNPQNVEEKFIKRFLPLLSLGYLGYKKDLNKSFPISETDTGMTRIPKGWGLSQSLLEELKKIPKKISKTKITRPTQQENLNHNTEKRSLTSTVKTHRRIGIKNELENLSRAGAKRLAPNYRENVKKRRKTGQKFIKVFPQKANSSKSDFSL